MREFVGDLLIGGMRLERLRGELLEESPQPGSRDWVLSGRLQLPDEKLPSLQLHRQYRLLLADGRAGQVLLVNITRANGDSAGYLLAEFQPQQARQPA